MLLPLFNPSIPRDLVRNRPVDRACYGVDDVRGSVMMKQLDDVRGSVIMNT